MTCPIFYAETTRLECVALPPMKEAPLSDRLAVLPQYLLPKQALTSTAGRFARARAGRWTTAAIERFIARYQVNMAEAENPDPAAYATFNDFFTRALKPGARPLADADMMRISGVGERKLHLYGDAFMEVVRKFVMDKSGEGAALGGSSYLQTWEMFKQGNSVEAIAEKRRMSPLTITGHLAIMYEKGELVDIRSWVRSEQLDLIQGALPLFGEPYELKEIYDHFEHKFSYTQIQFSIADFRKQRKK